MALSERLAYLITANGTDAIRTFETVGKSAEKNLGRADARLDRLAHRATITGAGMVAFAGVAAGALGKLGLGASDLNESLSKNTAVFGENAREIEQWANTAASAFGQSKQQALEAAGTYGNLFQAFGVGREQSVAMSKSLVGLAADLASFNNTSVDDAILALRSGLSGETEPLKRYGVAINDARLRTEALKLGLISNTKDALTPGAKAQAAYALVMHDTSLAQGDFGRTSGGLANQQRILSAEFQNLKDNIGTGVLPLMLDLIKPVNALVGGFNNLDPATQSAIGKFTAIGTATVGAVGGLSLMAGQLIKLRSRFFDTDAAGVQTLNTFGRFAQGAGIIGGLGAIGFALYEVGKAANDTTVDIQKMASSATDALAQSFEDFEAFQRSKPQFNAPDMEFTNKSIERFKTLAEGSIGTAKRLAAALHAQGYDTSQLDKIIRDTAKGQRQANADMHDGAAAADDLSEGFHTVGGSAAVAAAETVTFADALALTLGAHLALGDAESGLSDATQTLADDLSGVGDSASGSTEKVRTFQDAMHDTFDSLVDANEATLDYEDSVDALREAFGELGMSSENAADFMERFFKGGADDAKHSGSEVAHATNRAVKAAEAEVDAMVESGEIADTAAARKAALRQKLVELGNEFPQVKAQIDEYIGRLDKIPNLTTKAEDATSRLSTKKKDLKKDIRDVISAADDEATALEGTGTELEKAARHHGALLMILGDLKTRFPELAAVIQDYVNDINTAYEDFLAKQGLGTAQFGLGAFGLGGDAVGGGGPAPAPTPAPVPAGQRYSASGVMITQYISGEGLHSDEVADLVTTRTKRALVGARVA